MFETWSTTERPEWSWERFHAELCETLLDLTEGEILTVRVPRDPSAVPPRQGFLTRMHWSLTRGGEGEVDPFLQFFRMRDTLYCTCGGPVESGGSVRLAPLQQQYIQSLGWAQAEGNDRKRWGYPNYCAYFPHDGEHFSRPAPAHIRGEYRDLVDGPRASELAVQTLRGPLQASSPVDVSVKREG